MNKHIAMHANKYNWIKVKSNKQYVRLGSLLFKAAPGGTDQVFCFVLLYFPDQNLTLVLNGPS